MTILMTWICDTLYLTLLLILDIYNFFGYYKECCGDYVFLIQIFVHRKYISRKWNCRVEDMNILETLVTSGKLLFYLPSNTVSVRYLPHCSCQHSTEMFCVLSGILCNVLLWIFLKPNFVSHLWFLRIVSGNGIIGSKSRHCFRAFITYCIKLCSRKVCQFSLLAAECGNVTLDPG